MTLSPSRIKQRLGMPIEQVNAHLDDEMVMRIGVPHRSGSLAFHAFNEDFPAMISASAFWNRQGQCFRFQDATDVHELDYALDSAGFTAMQGWKKKGTQPGIGGVYPWTYEQYVELASIYRPSWWSQPDCCTEPEISGSQEEIDYRVDLTATMLEGTLRVVDAWQNKLAKDCSADTVANMVRPPVPILQGWSVDDYLRSLDMLIAVWERWTPWLAMPALIGLGSVCRRTLNHPTHGLYAVLAALEGRLPAGARLHLFGVKGECLSEVKDMPWIASADSMAYDFNSRVVARRAGVSNTMDLRAAEMSRWMAQAGSRMNGGRAPAGDQLQLWAA
jgi:hypothetical protein